MLLAVGAVVGFCLAWGLSSLLMDDPAHRGGGAIGVTLEGESPVTIGGRSTALIRPGVMVPLDLSFDNPHSHPVVLDEVAVTLTRVEAPRADAEHPCTLEDFAVRQLSGDLTLVLDGGTVSTLSDLDVADHDWPAVGMHDRPVNQDGCKDALITLAYEASSGAQR